LHFKIVLLVIIADFKNLLKRWLSGLKYWFAKPTCLFITSWVRIPFFSNILVFYKKGFLICFKYLFLTIMFFSPLEQFQIINVAKICFGNFDFSITNTTIFLAIGLSSFIFVSYSVLSNTGNFYIIPGRIQGFLESVYLVIYGLINDNVGIEGKAYFPYIFTIFTFILTLNIIGLVPYSFTVTSHLIVTFALALTTFIGINIICASKHGKNMFSLFLPSGSSLFLALLLVPIEIVSYIFRPISLSVRLFANMMAGHTLLKVIVGFA
jgi:F-type H+-transporting ATPase subunit a